MRLSKPETDIIIICMADYTERQKLGLSMQFNLLG